MKLFIVPQKNSGDSVYTLVAEDGEAYASHYCSHGAYAPGDLYHNRPGRIKELGEKYGEVEVMFLEDQTEITEAELLRRNKVWYESSKEPA